jgi:hypothetical protein
VTGQSPQDVPSLPPGASRASRLKRVRGNDVVRDDSVHVDASRDAYGVTGKGADPEATV